MYIYWTWIINDKGEWESGITGITSTEGLRKLVTTWNREFGRGNYIIKTVKDTHHVPHTER